MAEVFIGRVIGPSGFRRPVVLKRMLANLARQASFVDMFLDEARLIAKIRHPNVVQVQELVRDEGELFMVMEYLEGESVSSLVRRLVARRVPLPPEMAAFIVAEACAGLHAAHELVGDEGDSLGVVHRDVSPQNLFITFDGAVKVLDFGIAKARDRLAHTNTGELKGKLDYMAPEQCSAREVDRRTDVFALGVVLYELLTLRRLFKRPTAAATLRAILTEPVLPPSRLQPAIPRELETICLKALARSPQARYADAASMRRDLLGVVRSANAEPNEALGALMTSQFADRRAEKAEILRRIVDGSFPTSIPPAEPDDRVELPVVELTERQHVPERVFSRYFAVATLVALASGGVLYTLRARTPAPVVAAVQTAPAVAQRSVRVTIDSTPSGATVEIGGEVRGRTPFEGEVPFSASPSKLVLRLEGYLAREETLDRNADQHLRLELPRATAPARPAPSHPTRSSPQDRDVLTEKWPGR